MSKNRDQFAVSLMCRNVLTTYDPDFCSREREFNVIPGARKGTIDLVWNGGGGFSSDVRRVGLEKAIDWHHYGTFNASTLLHALDKAVAGKEGKVKFLGRNARRPRYLVVKPKTPATVIVLAPCRETREVRVSAIRRAVRKAVL